MPWWSYFLIVIPAVAVVGMIVYLLLIRCKYVRRESMLSDSENYFYHLLVKLTPQGYNVIPQPAMITCFDAKRRDRSTVNRILSKRFDYAIVRSVYSEFFPFERLVTIAVIELDDASHNQKIRKKRDKFVEKICRMNRLPLLRFVSKSNKNPDYDVPFIQTQLIRAIETGDIY